MPDRSSIEEKEPRGPWYWDRRRNQDFGFWRTADNSVRVGPIPLDENGRALFVPRAALAAHQQEEGSGLEAPSGRPGDCVPSPDVVGWTAEEYTPAVGRLHSLALDLRDALEALAPHDPDPDRHDTFCPCHPMHVGTAYRNQCDCHYGAVRHARALIAAFEPKGAAPRDGAVKAESDSQVYASGTMTVHRPLPREFDQAEFPAGNPDPLTPEEATPTTYTVNLDADPHEWITVVLTCLAGEGPHKPPHDTWAVRYLSYCLNDEGDWEWEPIPSSRDDEFLARTRWTKDEAIRRAKLRALASTEGDG